MLALSLPRLQRLFGVGVAIVLASNGAAAGSVYQWQDASGQTVYSQQPPPGGSSVKVPKKGGAPTSAPNSAQASPAKPAAKAADEVDKQPSAEDRRKLAQACEQAREVLRLLAENRRPRYIDAQGQRAYLTEEMKTERAADATRKAKEYCR